MFIMEKSIKDSERELRKLGLSQFARFVSITDSHCLCSRPVAFAALRESYYQWNLGILMFGMRK